MTIPSIRRFATLKGRSGRREFALLMALAFGADAALVPMFAQTDRQGPILWLGCALLLAISAVGVAAIVRRLHDLNLSAWGAYVFGIGVRLSESLMRAQGRQIRDDLVLVGLALAVTCLAAAPGTAGDNRFGPPPQAPAQTS